MNTKFLNTYFLKEHDTNPDKPKYRPPFLDHFDRKKTEPATILPDLKALHQQQLQQVHASQHHAAVQQHQHAMSPAAQSPVAPPVPSEFQQSNNQHQHGAVDTSPSAPSLHNLQQAQAAQDAERQRYLSHLQLQLNQISAANQMGLQHLMHSADNQQVADIISPRAPINVISGGGGGGAMKYQRNFVDGEFEFVRIDE